MKKQEVKEFIKTHRKEIITIVLGSGLAIFCGVKFHSRIKPIVSSVAEPDNTVMVFKGCDGKNLDKEVASLVLDSDFDIGKIGNQIHFFDDDGVNFTAEIIQFM